MRLPARLLLIASLAASQAAFAGVSSEPSLVEAAEVTLSVAPNGQDAMAPGEHPFFLRNQGWTPAGDLLPGDEVFSSRGGWLRVSSNTWVQGERTVYNLDVEEHDNFFVGELGAWVHNYEVNNTVSVPGRLRSVGPNQWVSSSGLRYGRDPSPNFANRVQHVLNHASDLPGRSVAHGVFAGGRRKVLGIVDEAFDAALRGGPNVTKVIQGSRVRYDVDLGRVVGFVGGQPGAAAGNPSTSIVRIVVQNGTDLITAFPY